VVANPRLSLAQSDKFLNYKLNLRLTHSDFPAIWGYGSSDGNFGRRVTTAATGTSVTKTTMVTLVTTRFLM